MPLFQRPINLVTGSIPDGRLLLVWPVVLEHRIDSSSPFWTLNAEDFRKHRFELVVLLEGVAESTGISVQARRSYLPHEILWGRRFRRLLDLGKDDGTVGVDFSLFHVTYPVRTPACSAMELRARRLRHSIISMTNGVDGGCDDGDDDAGSEDTDDRKRDNVINQGRPPTPLCLEPQFDGFDWYATTLPSCE